MPLVNEKNLGQHKRNAGLKKPARSNRLLNESEERERLNELFYGIRYLFNSYTTKKIREARNGWIHWVALYRILLEPRNMAGIIAIAAYVMKPMINGKGKYWRFQTRHWLVLFHLYQTPFATIAELKTMLELYINYTGDLFTTTLIKHGLVEKVAPHKGLISHYYQITQKGKEVVEDIQKSEAKHHIRNFLFFKLADHPSALKRKKQMQPKFKKVVKISALQQAARDRVIKNKILKKAGLDEPISIQHYKTEIQKTFDN